ncbi:hypothetical protein MAIT1_01363 [Magnetofaba australis IT-1]|uniref:DUF998 domain-containing protein n=2 Tax=Magnetofaba TaxID=1472292 RepID=A0A1Y2K306_9PROT|nr:hypothetical protein MAIT1_01363 [Magnetofaba australis IT-1]
MFGWLCYGVALLLAVQPPLHNLAAVARHGVARDLTPSLGIEASWLFGALYLLAAAGSLLLAQRTLHSGLPSWARRVWIIVATGALLHLLHYHGAVAGWWS